MKFINKIFVVALVFFISSCDMTELDLLQDPNSVAPENASVDDLYNSIQLDFGTHIQTMWFNTAGMSRMISHTGAYDYTSATTPTGFNFLWINAYSNVLPDIAALELLASERGLDYHSGTAKIMKAYILTSLVDLFGDVPNSQSGGGTDVIAPVKDPGADVYAAADALLVEAIAQLTGTTAPTPANDLAYDGDAGKWVKLAKSLQLRNAVTTRLVNSNAQATINALVAEGDIITSSNDDFVVQYGNTRQNPASRHPFYYNWYETADGNYMSNYYMYLLNGEKADEDGNVVKDPRIRYYFYRQVPDAVGLNENVYSCHFSDAPDQPGRPTYYPEGIPYCIVADGYFGRDHLNAEGIPPDGPVRTAYGIYPGGGQYDDDSFESVQQEGTTGALGEGIEPLMLASFVDFLRAEAALTIGTTDDPRALLESGVRKSIAKVMSFSGQFINPNQVISTDLDGNDILLEVLLPTEESIDEYVNLVLDRYDAADADGKLDVVMKEYYIALWGNGLESYNMYRRTGKPDNMAPALESNPGTFIRSFFLPAEHVNFNAAASQKTLTAPVFWDSNPEGFVD